MFDLLYKDEATSNCDRTGGNNWLTVVPHQDFAHYLPNNYQPGDPATVTVSCQFSLLTPIIGNILGNSLTLTAGASFPIRATTVDNICTAQITETGPTSPSATYAFSAAPSGQTSYAWAFGDGQTSTGQTTSHQYTAAGSYTVQLTITDASASICTTSLPLTVAPTAFPTANFSANPTSGTAPLAVQFNDLSSGTPTTWSWTFGDGATSTNESPSHTYTASGTYTVRLTVDGGSWYEMSIAVSSAAPPPIASFTFSPTSGDVQLFVQFTDTSSGSPTSWAWTFGDGGTSTAKNPSWTYTAAGTWTITLIATNANGPSSPVTHTINVSALCQLPNFVGDAIVKVQGVADVSGFEAREAAKWQAAGFTTSIIYSPNPTNKRGSVTSQFPTYSAKKFLSCGTTTITLFGNW